MAGVGTDRRADRGAGAACGSPPPSRFLIAGLASAGWLATDVRSASGRRLPEWGIVTGLPSPASSSTRSASSSACAGPGRARGTGCRLNPVGDAGAWFVGRTHDADEARRHRLALAGCLMVIGNGDPLALLHGGTVGMGEWLIVGCVLCWTAYTFIGAVRRRRCPAGATLAASILIPAHPARHPPFRVALL